MGNPETRQTSSQRKTEGGNVASRVNDADGNALLANMLNVMRRIEFHLSIMTNTTLKEEDFDDYK